MKTNHLFITLLMLFIQVMVNAQGLMCNESSPFCAEEPYTYPAGTSGQAEPGAYYACLMTQPAPAWFHMRIADPGSVTIYMYSTPLVDIDFVCWGPFEDPFSPCVAGLDASKVVDCSYSPNPTEYCNIPNGQSGEYYILLITNYSQTPAEITFDQISGNGSLDCTLLTGPEADFSATPLEGPAPLTVQFTDLSSGFPSTYKWDFQNDGIYDAFIPDPVHTYPQPGYYSVKLFIQNTEGADSVTKTDYISVLDTIAYPDLVVQEPSIGPNSVIPGQSVLAHCNLLNQGDTTAGNSVLYYYYSTDELLDDSDTLLSYYYCTMLDAGQYEFIMDTLVIPVKAAEGTAYILFMADAEQQVEESDEDNNLAYFEINVGLPASIKAPDKSGQALKIYPNPASDKLFIDFSGSGNRLEEVELLDPAGIRLAYKNYLVDAPGIMPLSLETIPPGLYFLCIRFSDGPVYQKILIIR